MTSIKTKLIQVTYIHINSEFSLGLYCILLINTLISLSFWFMVYIILMGTIEHTCGLYAWTSASSGGSGVFGCLLSKCCLNVLGSGICVWLRTKERCIQDENPSKLKDRLSMHAQGEQNQFKILWLHHKIILELLLWHDLPFLLPPTCSNSYISCKAIIVSPFPLYVSFTSG